MPQKKQWFPQGSRGYGAILAQDARLRQPANLRLAPRDQLSIMA